MNPPESGAVYQMVQLIEADDICRALVAALRPGLRRVYNVTDPGEVPISAIFREFGRKPIPLPHPVARAVVQNRSEATA